MQELMLRIDLDCHGGETRILHLDSDRPVWSQISGLSDCFPFKKFQDIS